MAHVQTKYLKLWKPQNLTVDKISSQRMFVDNMDALESFALSVLKRSTEPVASIEALRAINTSDTSLYTDGMMIMVKSKGLYFFDRGNTTSDNGNTIIAPTVGGGKWVSDFVFLGSLAFKNSLTPSDVGLGNVPNVATNNQTPTYTQSTSLVNLVSGEKLSVSFGKIMKAIADLISHLANKSNPHAVTKSQVGLSNVDNTADIDKPVSTAQREAINAAVGAGTDALSTVNNHIANKANPHGVTKSQVGLGSVPNVATNDQTPTYTQASTLANLTSGEKLSVSFGKIMKVIADFISHLANKANPHGVTASQVGLGNVPNVATNDQTPTFTQSSTLATLTSGEKLSVSFGKIMKGLSDLISHLASKSNPHSVTKSQVGLSNVDNTSDIDKPISTIMQTVLDSKADVINGEIPTKSYARLTGFKLVQSGSLNDIKFTGNYGISSTCTDKPSNEYSYGVLEVIMYSSHWLIQRYYGITSNGDMHGIFYRTYYGDTTWSSWKRYSMGTATTLAIVDGAE